MIPNYPNPGVMKWRNRQGAAPREMNSREFSQVTQKVVSVALGFLLASIFRGRNIL